MIEADILERKLDEVREQLREIWLRRMAARLLVFVSVLALSLGLAAGWKGAVIGAVDGLGVGRGSMAAAAAIASIALVGD
jgi:hypothetical protein